jgi:hypothetical protein
MIPIIYDLAEAARILGFSESYLRAKLRDRTFAGMKRAGRWAMTEAQIEAAIESMCIDARAADPRFPDWTPAELVEFLCRTHAGCYRDTEVTRIE